MNRKEAIDKSVKIWRYLAETGAEDKVKAYSNLKLETDRYLCPLCVFIGEIGEEPSCTNCPMYGLWPNSSNTKLFRTCSGYYGEKKAYDVWARVDDRNERKRLAKLIADAIDELKR